MDKQKKLKLFLNSLYGKMAYSTVGFIYADTDSVYYEKGENTMYESPIAIFERNNCNKLTEEKENLIIPAVQEVGVTVDKEELIKALRYDRKQYEKGYADAKQEAIDIIKHRLQINRYTYQRIVSELNRCIDDIQDIKISSERRKQC